MMQKGYYHNMISGSPVGLSCEHGKMLNIEKWFLNLMETIWKSGKENAMQETQVQSLGQEESL